MLLCLAEFLGYAQHFTSADVWRAVNSFGWYFVATGVTSMLARPLLGRVSDQIGAGRSLIIAFALESAAPLLMPLAGIRVRRRSCQLSVVYAASALPCDIGLVFTMKYWVRLK